MSKGKDIEKLVNEYDNRHTQGGKYSQYDFENIVIYSTDFLDEEDNAHFDLDVIVMNAFKAGYVTGYKRGVRK